MLYDMTHYCVGITGSTKVFHICFVELSVDSVGLVILTARRRAARR